MARSKLEHRQILVVEDEPLIAMDVAESFKEAGANVTVCRTLPQAMAAVARGNISAGVLDHALGQDDSSVLCEELHRRDIPYFLYSGLPEVDGPCEDAPLVAKPASRNTLIATMEQLLERSSLR